CRKIEDWLGETAPGGECWADFDARIGRALDRILASPRPAAIVAHMVVNAALAARLAGANPKRFNQRYGEIYPVLLEPRAGPDDSSALEQPDQTARQPGATGASGHALRLNSRRGDAAAAVEGDVHILRRPRCHGGGRERVSLRDHGAYGAQFSAWRRRHQ